MPLPEPVVAFLGERHGIGARQQLLREFDVSAGQVSGWLRRGVLEEVQRGVIGLPGLKLTPKRMIYAAVLRCGEGAMAGGPNAAYLHGLEGFTTSHVPFVLVPRHRRVTGVDFTVKHWGFHSCDRGEIERIPVARIPLTLVDLAALYKPKVVRVAFDDARRRGKVRADRVFERAEALGERRGARELLALCVDTEQDSEGERNMAGLFLPDDPQPAWQVWVYDDVRVDAAFLEARLVLEYQSRKWHGLDSDRGRDSARALRLRADRIEVIDVTAEMLWPENRKTTRERILTVRADRMARGYEPIVPVRFGA